MASEMSPSEFLVSSWNPANRPRKVDGAARASPTAPPEVSAGGHAIITIPGKANTLTDAPLSQFDPFQQVRPAMAAGRWLRTPRASKWFRSIFDELRSARRAGKCSQRQGFELVSVLRGGMQR